MRHRRVPHRQTIATAILAAAAGLLGSACSVSSASNTATATSGPVVAVGAQNTYANVISQIGGPYVRVTAIESNPNTDPHTFQTSASVSEVVSAAELVVQNGAGYDSFMDSIENAAPNSRPQGDHRPALARAGGSAAEPASVVLAGDHAGGRES